MDSQHIVFLEVMAAVAVVGIVAFLVLLLARSAGESRLVRAPRWYEFALALVLLVVVVVVLAWQFPPLLGGPDEIAVEVAETVEGEEARPPVEPADWRSGNRADNFFTVMLLAAAIGLVAFVVVLFARILPAQEGQATAKPEPEPAAEFETPSAMRLLGLLGFALAILLLNWTYLERPDQYLFLRDLLYPAALAVGLVLLVDKASRAWASKGAAETLREWLFCDAFVLFLVLAYLNLRHWQPLEEQAYAGMFWDVVNIAAFFLAFWLVDRKRFRLRFLLAYVYVALLPIVLLIWRSVQAVPEFEGSWWESLWPCFLLTLIFLVLEIIHLVASREAARHGVGAFKDVVFVVLYGILLLVAIPEVAA
jgi:hypothetical protein